MRFTTTQHPLLRLCQSRDLAGERGAAIAEAALVLPLFFLLLFAIFGFGLLMSNYQSMVDAAREGSRYGTAPLASGGYALPNAGQIAQRTCSYLQTAVLGGNKNCSKYTGSTAPPAITSCTDSSFTSATAAEDVYVGVPPATVSEVYNPNGASAPLTETQVVVGIRKAITLPVLGYTLKYKTCSSMRSENN